MDARARTGLERIVVRLFFGTGMAVALAAAAAYAFLPLGLPQPMQALVVGACAVTALVFAFGARMVRSLGTPRACSIAAWTSLVAVMLVAWGLGEGVHSVVLGFFGVLVCLAGATVGLRTGLAMAAFAATGVTLLAVDAHLPGTDAPPMDAAGALRLLTQLVLIASGAAAGSLIALVTARYRRTAADRERRFRSLLRIAADWYWEMDERFKFTQVSEELEHRSTPATERFIGQTPWQIDDFGLTPAEMDAHRSDLEAHRSFSGLLLRRRDSRGRVTYTQVSGEPRFDEHGVFRGYWGVGRDATAEVQAQLAVAASESRYRELFDRAPSPLILHRNGKVIDANPAAIALYGYSSLSDFIGQDAITPYASEAARRLGRARIEQLESAPVGTGLPAAEFELRSATGQRLWVLASAVRVHAAGGPATLSIFFDETERRMADAALRRSEELLSLLVANSPDAVTLTETHNGRYAMVNPAFTRLTGFTATEVIGRTTEEVGIWQHPADRERVVREILRHGRIDEMPMTFVSKQGVPLQTRLSAARFEMEGRDYLVLNVRDVTQGERLRLAHEAILQNASIGIALTRSQRFVLANPRFEEMLGWPPGALIGQPGAVVWPSMTDYEAVGREAGPVLAAGQAFEGEHLMRRMDGSVFWCRLRARVVDQAHPSHGGTIWIAEDVTEQRRTAQALSAARDAAEAANRAKSAFLANTSHEIRTPLNGLLGLARLAMHPDIDEARRQQYLNQILESAEGLSVVISDILDFSKIEAGKLLLESVRFDVRSLVDGLHATYRQLALARGLELSLRVDDGVPACVEGDPLRVRQILGNYLANALKFTDAGAVELRVEALSPPWIRFSVADTGAGIDRSTLARLFKPFTQADESTTRRFGGTGLGLSICHELSVLMGGRVGVESEVGRGSRFWAELPLRAAPAPDHPARPAAHQHSLAGRRVLMAEDNPVNMMIATATLEQWGVVVTPASDGGEAVDKALAAATRGQPFDAVLMDVQMPGMSGHEAARRLRARFDADALPIIALTAAALVSERDEALAAGMNDFLTKPVDAQRLQQVLARWLLAARAH
jgi:PAS domain S-box-containing protein